MENNNPTWITMERNTLNGQSVGVMGSNNPSDIEYIFQLGLQTNMDYQGLQNRNVEYVWSSLHIHQSLQTQEIIAFNS